MSPAAISARGLVRDYGDTRAVDGVDLEIEAGEIYGFLGPNGAGKTTLIRVLCTLLAPTAGSARVAGYDVGEQSQQVRRRIGVALQSAALDDKQTGIEMLRLQGRFYGLARHDLDRRVTELTELIDLGGALTDRVATYSGGMRRRLDLALALVHGPSVLFLDEPTTGLDPVSRSAVWQEVRRLNRESGITVFLTTQYLEEADELAGRVGIIRSGRIVAEGSPDELKRSVGIDLVVVNVDGDAEAARRVLAALPQVERVDVNGSELTVAVLDGPTALSPVAVALAGAAGAAGQGGPGLRVRDLALRTPTLDDVFLSVTGERISAADSAPPGGTEQA